MKVFITGATGFLGKQVLNLLLSDQRIEQVDLVSRKKLTHPDPRVRVHQLDLSEPWSEYDFLEESDAIIHLAGLYDFKENFSQNYQQNVLPILNLVDRVRDLKRKPAPPILFASTYAVGFGGDQVLKEEPLKVLPPTYQSYAYTKAVAERALTDSGLAAHIFRLGILVGDSVEGHFEKIDGPYYLMRFLETAKKLPLLRFLKRIPLPYSPNGFLPLVPVDSAARIFYEALFLPALLEGEQHYYGVFNPESVQVELLGRSIFKEFLPGAEPRPLHKEFPHWIEKNQTKLTGIPKEFFNFSIAPVMLENPKFVSTFGAHRVPHFNEFRLTFFKGFHRCYKPNSAMAQ
ncbi:MAG: SDR family oxidoreductase [Bdellovibrio sp.]|nr:SDR family oxidoreductase [Bdellovibrio sp.]